MAMTPAMESIFANAQQNAASLIDTATLAINAKVHTIDEAESMIQELSSEAVKFNELLTTIANAMRQVESGDMQKEEATSIIAPAVKELKDKCTALKIANAEAPGDDITEDEIAILRELIIGVKAAAEDRLTAIRLGDDDRVDPEVEAELDDAEESYSYSEIATEAGLLAAKYVHTNETKTAKALYSNAKKLYSLGSKDKALQYMKKAESLYKKALDSLLKSGKFEKAELTNNRLTLAGTRTIRKNITRTDSMTFNIARSSLEHKIDRCTAHILLWTTKAGKEDYQQILDQLIADREEAKAAKKAAKATENYVNGGNNMDFCEAYESIIDNAMLEEMDYEAATEGANWDAHKLKKQYSKEIRALAKEAKKNYKVANYSVAKQMYNKCADLCNQMASEVKSMSNTAGQVMIGNLLHSLKTIGSCLLVGGIITSIKDSNKELDLQIDQLNKAGKGELTRTDANRYINDIAAKAKKMADKFKKLADKAAKGELESVGANESFDYDEFMFTCESMMDDLQTELDTDMAMESDEDSADEGGATASGIGTKLRSLMSKFKNAFKHGDKKEAEEIKAEIDATTNELVDEASDADDGKKSKLMKAAKIGLIAAGTVAAVAGLTSAGIAIKQKASGEKIDIAGGAKAMRTAVSTALNNMRDDAALASVNRKARKEQREADKQTRANRALARQMGNGHDKVTQKRIDEDNKNMAEYNKAKASGKLSGDMSSYGFDKNMCKIAGEYVAEAFGVSAFDAYEVILEAMCCAVLEGTNIESDDDLASAIESIL